MKEDRTAENQNRPNPQRIMHMASAFYESCVLFAATDLGLFDVINEAGNADAETVASAKGLSSRGTRLLLDACVAVGLLRKEDDQYHNTDEAAAFLVSGQPGDLSRALRYNRDVYPAWGKLAELVRSGEPVERPQIHLGEDPQRTQAFVHAMHGRAMAIGQAVVPLLELGECSQLLDIGGGSGAYSMLIAQRFPGLSSTVIDLPGILEVSRTLVDGLGLSDRVQCLDGDYHTFDFPGGNDAVIIFGVLHQEGPESILDILKRAHASLNPGGRIYILDMMTDATRCNPPFSALFAVNMALTKEEGWVFADTEMITWLTEAGFQNPTCQSLQPPMPHWLATATK
ncbi:MAG: class I SAM-dependent methyltransferase [Kiritimatiellia bacterium]|jgi:ubiquinone/menaquinone biosynthesis C-methylase UbiE|nr:class I SAM-dependent methyltransferase [Kiritimatiellia bacterium]MDP6847410.1 class I SAM-dependent methyltransferase [Kiritimatiellia bacterium]